MKPHFVKPMLATLVDEPFNRRNWIFEIKWDGYRTIAVIDSGKVELFSRNQLSFNEKYPQVALNLKSIKHTAVLDGEIVALDDHGKPNFQILQNFGSQASNLAYYVFDLLFLDGKDLKALPLMQRKAKLKAILPKRRIIKFSDHIVEKGKKFFFLAKSKGLEGIVAKDASSPYRPAVRGNEWLKIKTSRRQEAIICGFTEPKGGRKFFGSLVLGAYDQGKLRYVGQSGGGFTYDSLKSLHLQLNKLIILRSPFDYAVKAPTKITWVKPKLVCEIKFTEWTGGGQMRHPVFVALRDDKKPKEVKIEKEKSAAVII